MKLYTSIKDVELNFTSEAVPRIGETLIFDTIPYIVANVIHSLDFLSDKPALDFKAQIVIVLTPAAAVAIPAPAIPVK